MADPDPLLERVIDATLLLAAERPWNDVTVRDVAAQAGADLAELYGRIGSKTDIVDAIFRRFDRAAVAKLDLEADASARERAFEAAMARFEAMEAHREGLAPILAAAGRDPVLAARAIAAHVRTARWLLEIGGVDTAGAAGVVRVQGFAAILGQATRAWLKEEAGDMARTMRSLDRNLRDVEAWGERLAGLSRRRSARPPGDDQPAAPDPVRSSSA